MKRISDISLSVLGLVLLWPVFALVAVGLKLTSPGPIFFRQERMGLDGKRFFIFKFRTMTQEKLPNSCQVTAGGDPRITPFGRFLRRYKLDEYPQLLNVLRGDMSLVGPRPEVVEFVDLYPEEYHRILKVRPGITHPATLSFRREEEILATNPNPREFYVKTVLPEKLAAYEADLEQSLARDIWTIVETIMPHLGATQALSPDHFSPNPKPSAPFVPTLVANIPALADEEEFEFPKAKRAQQA